VISNVIVDVESDNASAVSYVQVLRSVGLVTWGRYIDAFRNVEGTWRIVERRVVVDGQQQKPT
jgi:hypothetical protein